MKIGIIVGSIRDDRAGSAVGQFVKDVTERRDGNSTYEVLELHDFDVPLLTTHVHPMQANRQYDDERVRNWSAAIAGLDAFVFVTPEYNHSVPGAFKNAVDSLGSEWLGKPVAFVGYGSVGGVRAIEHWRQIVSNFSMPFVRAEMNFNLFSDWSEGEFAPTERRADEVNAMLDQLERLAEKHR